MSLDNIISRLNKVKKTGSGCCIACCPAHDDHSPSLSIRELDDGRVLIKCWAGCSAEAILESIGLNFSDLYPEPLTHRSKPQRRPFNAHDVLACLVMEMRIVMMAGIFICRGQALSAPDMKRLMIAVNRINEAYEVCNA